MSGIYLKLQIYNTRTLLQTYKYENKVAKNKQSTKNNKIYYLFYYFTILSKKYLSNDQKLLTREMILQR